ncbi:hypothetical protein TrVE_jg10855 [Triparma verrucosa]|uniref:Uncharacterized protein n=1 Tax=Triparma verrucosa TaxID=1606542 RepID=A0A9W7EX10_9STRA|nr:hypothetical protein TrVE_jg10855 [Triparma verrucosa]
MHTDDFKRLLFEFAPGNLLMKMQLLCKDWRRVADTFIDGEVESGEMIVIGGNDLSYDAIIYEAIALEERRTLVTQVVFLLNVTKVGERSCEWAVNLVVVEIPEGVESIGDYAFADCCNLTTVSFPTTLTSISIGVFQECSSLDNVDLFHAQLQEIGAEAFFRCSELKSMALPDSLQTLGDHVFEECYSLESVDLLHTNLREIGDSAFRGCPELKSLTIPDSLQTLGINIFLDCMKLVPFHLDEEETKLVISHLRSQQSHQTSNDQKTTSIHAH